MTISVLKSAASDTRKLRSPHCEGARDEGRGARDCDSSLASRPSPLAPSSSYCQSGSSGCFWSHSGRRLCTVGITSKLYAAGGDVVVHSSVHASQGSSPAGRPLRSDANTLYTKTTKLAAWMIAPTVVNWFQNV